MRPHVLVTRRLPAAVMAPLEAVCDVNLHGAREALTPDALQQRLTGTSALVCMFDDQIDRAAIDAGADLTVIANVAVGYENIDVPYARSRGITVTNTPDVLTESAAEFTWGLLLSLTRRIAEGDRLVRAGRWKGWAFDFMLGPELGGKRLGIVGPGRIGRAVAAKADAFGMEVVFSGRPNAVPGEPGTALSAPRVSFDELLVTADVVSLHVPLTEDTRYLIDRRALARMKRTACLVNTSRGPIVDEEALVWALGERLIAGAALDVYEHEPAVHPGLAAFDAVVLSPHLGTATRETRTVMAELAVANVLAVLAGDPPLTPVG